jgi:hypothetical protein
MIQITPPDRGLLMVVLVNCLTSCARRDRAADTSIPSKRSSSCGPSAFLARYAGGNMLRKVGWQRGNASRGPPPDYVFFFGRSARSSRNSPGPFRSRRFLCCCSSAVADGSASLSICWPARSMAFDVAFGASPLHELRSCQPQLDKPTDGLGAVRFIGLPRCPSVHIFTQFGRKPDCRHWVSPSGRPASLFSHYVFA